LKAKLLSRRDLIEKCVAAGLLGLASPLRGSAAALWLEAQLHPTPRCEMGPFYKKQAPSTGALRTPGDAGMPLLVSGRVIDTRGEALQDAVVEVWHADHFGHYDNVGYRFRGKLPVTGAGEYRFESVIPGHYPGRVAQHVHYRVEAPGHQPLVTQLYFGTDPVFEGDPDKNFSKDPLVASRELVRPVTLRSDTGSVQAAVVFELCLERA